MKHTALVSKSLFSSTERLKVSSSLGHNIAIKSKFYAAQFLSINRNVKINSVSDLSSGSPATKEVGEDVHRELRGDAWRDGMVADGLLQWGFGRWGEGERLLRDAEGEEG
jgi:hypothetical protein